jgi:hypothetical protein
MEEERKRIDVRAVGLLPAFNPRACTTVGAPFARTSQVVVVLDNWWHWALKVTLPTICAEMPTKPILAALALDRIF